jgi:cellulose synthase/poly-beta-1,6-N-acetylglucosamine synthase-like glycosyltransferase
MGRILVVFCLATVVMVIAGVLFALDQLIRLAWHMLNVWFPGSVIPRLPYQPLELRWGGPLYRVVIIFFAIALPGALILQYLVDRAKGRAAPTGSVPPPFDVKQGPVVAVLTAYNDELSIGLAVDEFRARPEISEVIVIDNNCIDRTAAVAKEHGATVIVETKQGYGHACMAGLRYALEHTKAQAIVLAEGDMTFFGDDIAKVLPYLTDVDLVVGTRATRTLTRPGSQMDWFLSWGNLFLAFLIRLRFWDWTFLGRVQLTDVGCTFRAIRRDALQRIIGHLDEGGDSFSPHMILVALREGLWVVEAPIQFRKRVGLSKGAGRGRKRAFRIGVEMIAQIALF